MSSVCTSLGSYASYTLDCPVYRDMAAGASQSQLNTADPACVPCAGNCVGTTAGTSGAAAQLSATNSAIIGGVVGGVGGLLVLGLVAFFVVRSRRGSGSGSGDNGSASGELAATSPATKETVSHDGGARSGAPTEPAAAPLPSPDVEDPRHAAGSGGSAPAVV
jgi:hypothetical protein